MIRRENWVFGTWRCYGEVGALTRTTGLGTGSTILPGEEVVLYSYEFEPEAMDTILSILSMENDEDDPFDFGAIYTSIYEDEHWHVTSNSDNPTIIDWSK